MVTLTEMMQHAMVSLPFRRSSSGQTPFLAISIGVSGVSATFPSIAACPF
jgi:hypothetical protein